LDETWVVAVAPDGLAEAGDQPDRVAFPVRVERFLGRVEEYCAKAVLADLQVGR
jgi:hypothetical protein